MPGCLVHEAHQAAADFYNAPSPAEIVFGQNMTTLTLHMSRCLAHDFSGGRRDRRVAHGP